MTPGHAKKCVFTWTFQAQHYTLYIQNGENQMSNEVAKTILSQLGGNRFSAMTGAKNFVGSADSLSFTLPGGGGFCRDGINVVRVVLTPADLYDVEFIRRRGSKIKTVKKVEAIFFDQLRPTFEQATGLRTSL